MDIKIQTLIFNNKKYLLSKKESDRMTFYKNIYQLFLECYTTTRERTRYNFITFVNLKPFHGYLFNGPTGIRDVLIIQMLNAVIMDEFLTCNGLPGLQTMNLVKGFDCLRKKYLEERGYLFIWDRMKIMHAWKNVVEYSQKNNVPIHWLNIKKYCEQAKNQNLSTGNIFRKTIQINPFNHSFSFKKDESNNTSKSSINNNQFYKMTCSIWKDMFSLPKDWSIHKTASYVQTWKECSVIETIINKPVSLTN